MAARAGPPRARALRRAGHRGRRHVAWVIAGAISRRARLSLGVGRERDPNELILRPRGHLTNADAYLAAHVAAKARETASSRAKRAPTNATTTREPM
jgi:hypothetical protein